MGHEDAQLFNPDTYARRTIPERIMDTVQHQQATQVEATPAAPALEEVGIDHDPQHQLPIMPRPDLFRAVRLSDEQRLH